MASPRGSGRGASLGLAFKDWRRVVILALLGALGLFVGAFAGLTLAASAARLAITAAPRPLRLSGAGSRDPAPYRN
jgi:hypothetical protein